MIKIYVLPIDRDHSISVLPVAVPVLRMEIAEKTVISRPDPFGCYFHPSSFSILSLTKVFIWDGAF